MSEQINIAAFNQRRQFLRAGLALTGAGVLSACASKVPVPITPVRKDSAGLSTSKMGNGSQYNMLRIFASSGFAEDASRCELGMQRLAQAGFMVSNQNACFRRFQRFAGSDAQRVADFQEVATGRVPTPKVMMSLRGGYGAVRVLPHVDWASLGSRMREGGTMLFGFSDVTAIQLALLAKGQMCSFSGPTLYGDFGKTVSSSYTMDSFVNNAINPHITISVNNFQHNVVEAQGVFWGGNLSVLASLVGSAYMPNIEGGILFLEDVGEQPYRIERMLKTLYLAGILQKQQAIVLGDFRMGSIRDVYDGGYTLSSVLETIESDIKIPILRDFPFGHIENKATFPLGAQAKIMRVGGGYQVRFSDYPVLNGDQLSLNTLLPPPAILPSFFGGEGIQMPPQDEE